MLGDMRRTHDRAAVVVGLGVVGAAGPLLRRMRREFEAGGQLSTPTVVWMYGTYAAHAVVTAEALWSTRPERTGIGSQAATVAGYALAAAGAVLITTGIGRFTGARQVSGMDDGRLAVGGVYRWTRNPQYVGYATALAGLAWARRSARAGALAAGAAGALVWWVPVEERHLAKVFGVPYQRYLAATPRWIGPAARSQA